ncbi:MAG: helix-turn-helix domain-containing protein, partial [Candidatus Ornithospirochaeta sp.]
MFSKNLKYYRLKNNLSKAALASKIGVTPMAITNYENGDRRPDMLTIKALANVLGVKISDFLAVRNANLTFVHEEFRKCCNLSKNQQEYVQEAVEEYFNRFYEVVELLGGEVLPESPKLHEIVASGNPEEDGISLRRYLGLSERGPVGNLIELLENLGILVCLLDIGNKGFSGVNGNINGRPYIAINKNMTAERIRTTIVHELAHFSFLWPEKMEEKECEKYATAIAGSFLFPKEDAIRELGIRRRSITSD